MGGAVAFETSLPTARRGACLALLPALCAGCPLEICGLDDASSHAASARPTDLAVRGANLVGFYSAAYVDTGNHLTVALDRFSEIGGNWLAVTFWWFQDSATATEIAPDHSLYTISDEAIQAAVRAAHEQGLQVLLRPMVDIRGGAWRGAIRPSEAWFDSYRRFILAYAQQAANWEVAAFSVGAELSETEGWQDQWRRLIADVRAIYSGPVVYSALHDAALRLDWWDAVDIIGVDEYSPVALLPSSNACTMAAGWTFWLEQLENGLVARFPGKPVWLTEVGVRSARGAASQPWCWQDPCGGFVDADIVDLAEQANYYEAVLLAASARTWLQGVFWWSWDPDPTAPYISGPDYSPQGKPAEDILVQYWTSPSPP